ncbi:MAG: hypothetical protein A2487_00225 [Candidatus Raymondbacteria bacterium RifOxyC12_full_50_8]|uniref:Xylose isomerase-like TIM barrel domain-containing protein n=1 Tax=Candidatus Raymondbacteria bacterium RIFOXYD12_FULL_49_13 TaxID=1817890 RepID=A0A1F7FL84_UNCRA|nr:MAG: hypothetical protein A2248_08735 [Candidatus Raymondbacteria bacterium RIFOXYA2_FULL_49_16]OGK07479.1 MAG: hypothetical protein A2519_20180 [Candidatus Raymondbacteria bacterium RIFOXYD12_FULL_49_13]OGK07765.1 MAG: hypothetical protein A2487_00225 [Candidatus Raymondbacteria bacterium RifOxyC12_full_50_8]OGP43835.1 MAG: hypothetical protein A2324_01410 [Candidatus Raymondbacteria bacterium RIFOXYB2_FULL_49_35]
MKFSATDWSFLARVNDPAAYYGSLGEAGYQGVELVDAARYSLVRSAGLSIVNIAAPGREIGMNRLEHQLELLPRIREVIDSAAANKIEQVVVFSGSRAGLSDAMGVENCARGFEELIPHAAKNRVTLCLEMMNSIDHKDYQADGGEFGFALAKKINSPWFKVLYDLYHMHRMNEPLLDDLTANMALVGHLHIAGLPDRSQPTVEGEIPYGCLVPGIVAAGYSGYWGMEFVPRGDSIAELVQARETIEQCAKHTA